MVIFIPVGLFLAVLVVLFLLQLVSLAIEHFGTIVLIGFIILGVYMIVSPFLGLIFGYAGGGLIFPIIAALIFFLAVRFSREHVFAV